MTTSLAERPPPHFTEDPIKEHRNGTHRPTCGRAPTYMGRGNSNRRDRVAVGAILNASLTSRVALLSTWPHYRRQHTYFGLRARHPVTEHWLGGHELARSRPMLRAAKMTERPPTPAPVPVTVTYRQNPDGMWGSGRGMMMNLPNMHSHCSMTPHVVSGEVSQATVTSRLRRLLFSGVKGTS